MLRVGLTGGAGAGRSSVARRLAELGAVVIDSTVFTREGTQAGTPGPARFGDASRRLLRPGREESGEQVDDSAVVVEDVPLLVENDLGALFQLVLLVHAPEEQRVRRLVAERNLPEAQAWSQLRAEANDAARRAAADVWIDTTGAPEEVTRLVDGLWNNRLVPYEANLRAGRRAPRRLKPVVFEPDPLWPVQARRLIARLAAAVGEQVIRIDHIGSTSVPGLPAKDLIDIQVVVADLEVAARVAEGCRAAGFVRVDGRWCGRDRHGNEHEEQVAVDADPGRPVNVNVRAVTAPVWRETLLFRDWLRADPDGRARYAALKRDLAARPGKDVNDYGDDKMPWISAALVQALAWARQVGWNP